ncbi:nuclear transport factor 2 family protein [Streptomyces sp. NPDC020898]|uniref:nuclear transport factor 2 family protein n=1 Tax=Streptomyces sp. NPDC020898 TaxID=3365101 RepID=UPI003796F1F1
MSEEVLELSRRYIALWNEPDDAERLSAAGTLFTGDGLYVDPQVTAEGPEAITAYINEERKKFEGLAFSLGEVIGSHHGLALFTWRLGPVGSQEAVATGYDTVLVEGGRLRQVYGFFA